MSKILSINDNTAIALAEAVPTQQHYLRQATAPNTRRAYQSAIQQFEQQGGQLPATEQMIAHYLTQRANTLNPRTLSLHLTALSHWHHYQKLPDPTQSPAIRKLMVGILRQHGQPKRQAKALYPEHIAAMVAQAQQHYLPLKCLRDCALILIGYFGAFRRSELVAMRVEHLQFDSRGVQITIPRSKTDQTGQGCMKALPYGQGATCPVAALQSWLTTAAIDTGYLFRAINRWGHLQSQPLHPDSISVLLKALARYCGWEFANQLSSHSLRRGFATSAARAGIDFEGIKRQGDWKNDQTVRMYIEEGRLFDDNAAGLLMQTAFYPTDA